MATFAQADRVLRAEKKVPGEYWAVASLAADGISDSVSRSPPASASASAASPGDWLLVAGGLVVFAIRFLFRGGLERNPTSSSERSYMEGFFSGCLSCWGFSGDFSDGAPVGGASVGGVPLPSSAGAPSAGTSGAELAGRDTAVSWESGIVRSEWGTRSSSGLSVV